MLELLNEFIDLQTSIWLFFVFFVLHELEEIMTLKAWSQKKQTTIQRFFSGKKARLLILPVEMSTSQFVLFNSLVIGILSIATIIASYEIHHQGNLIFFTACLISISLHLIAHFIYSIMFRGYTPGVLTALFLLLPYSLYLFHRLFVTHLLHWDLFNESFTWSLVAIPLTLVIHKISHKLEVD